MFKHHILIDLAPKHYVVPIPSDDNFQLSLSYRKAVF